MNAAQLSALLQVSAYHDPEPEAVFRAILDAVTSVYGDTMAMINLIDGDRIQFRAVSNPHRLMRRARSILLQDSYCQFATGPGCPVLIQNAATDAQHEGHSAVRFGLTRYLGVPISNPAGEPLGTLCFLDGRSDEPLDQTDVEFLRLLAMRASAELERERLIEARLEEEREVARQYAGLADKLQRAAEEKRRFTATVIHDLRHPISTLRTLFHVLRSQPQAGDADECLDLMDRSVNDLHGMVDELLEYAEIEAGALNWHREACRLEEVIGGCVLPLKTEADELGVRLTLEMAPTLGIAEADPAKVAHVVCNLVENAIKYAAPLQGRAPDQPAHVRVQAGGDGERWWVIVEDNGIGMTPEVQSRIFEEFYRAPGAAGRAVAGRGLGLSIVRHLCDAMGAEVSVESEPGTGSRFQVAVPR